MDISIAQFKKHYVCVCVIIAFSLTGILSGYKEFLASHIFPLSHIEMAYNASFLIFFAIGVMLPQWLLKAVFLTEHFKAESRADLVATLPSGRADLQPVTLVMSGVSLLLALFIVCAVFWQGAFCAFRMELYRSFLLGGHYWLCDGFLVFIFTGIVWILAGFLCAILYRMAVSLTTQTGVYQTLEQRFYMQLLGGYVGGMLFWPFMIELLDNIQLVLLLSLLPLAVSAFWLPAVFSRSAEKSYIKHFELKTGVQERSYISVSGACLLVYLGGVLLGGYLPVLAHVEAMSGFDFAHSRYHNAFLAGLIYIGWYLSFRREISGRQYEAGSIIPLYRWSAACLGTVFVLALINRQGWCNNILAVLVWYSFYCCGVIFLGDMLFILKQLIPRALASLALSWVLWVVMSCLGCLSGELLFAHFLLNNVGSLMVMITLFFTSVIASGTVIIFTSPQEIWHKRVVMLCVLPIIFSTLIIFWISHNWILRKHENVVGYNESLCGTWAIRQYGQYDCWFAAVDGVLCGQHGIGDKNWGLRLKDITSDISIKKALIAGAAVEDLAVLKKELKKDIVIDPHMMGASKIAISDTAQVYGINSIYNDFEQVLSDSWQSYDLIWLDGEAFVSAGINRNLWFWHRVIRLLKVDGILVIGVAEDADSQLLKQLSESIGLLSRAAGFQVSLVSMAPDDYLNLPGCKLLTVLNNKSVGYDTVLR